jgi:hypothetical protein
VSALFHGAAGPGLPVPGRLGFRAAPPSMAPRPSRHPANQGRHTSQPERHHNSVRPTLNSETPHECVLAKPDVRRCSQERVAVILDMLRFGLWAWRGEGLIDVSPCSQGVMEVLEPWMAEGPEYEVRNDTRSLSTAPDNKVKHGSVPQDPHAHKGQTWTPIAQIK